MSLTARQEQVGKRLMEIIAGKAQHFDFADLLVLRAAWTGKLSWNEMPTHIREAFFKSAVEITKYVTQSLTDGVT